ncbi:hypothetical protein ACFPTX_20260 [Pseudomonas sp. GCM10022188]|uniref:hypothetical protein n=1 Tax=Pseudomonas TaxID=286 RepID=UPI001E587714|nr:hypothetical protein [Pseudomonas oryzagri]MCC6074043.1 hypothetical protein [Pseudomonas oryzagri]
MHFLHKTQSEFDAFARQIHTAALALFPLSRSKLNEALARGFGKKTYASLVAGLKMPASSSGIPFNYMAFVARLAELEGLDKAISVGSLVDGISISIEIEKWPSGPGGRQQPHRYSDVSYHVSVEVRGGEYPVQGNLPFILPVFEYANIHEPFRVDSGISYRVTEGHYVSRYQNGLQTLRGAVIDGRWGGEMFIYDYSHQRDDRQAISQVKSALAKVILSVVSPRVTCSIYRPDSYDPNARRLEIALGAAAKAHLGTAALPFKMPDLERRHLVIDKGFRGDVDVGVLVDGVWKADLYSNGVDEVENPTSLDSVCLAYLAAIEGGLVSIGFNGGRG